MTQYTRTIGRQVTNALPAWRTAMVNPDTLYYVSAAAPAEADPYLQIPHGLSNLPSHFTTNEAYARDVIGGYSSGTLVEDAGAFGQMVIGTGGHTRFQTHLLSLDLSADAPVWRWFQQPRFEVSNTNSADVYYNPAEHTALANGVRGLAAIVPDLNVTGTVGAATTPTTTQFTPSAIVNFPAVADFLLLRTITFNDNTPTVALRNVTRICSANTSAALPLITLATALPVAPASGDTFIFLAEDMGRWDRAFPVAYQGWIYPAKITTGQLGGNVIHGNRYSIPSYIDAAATGWGAGGYVTLTNGPQGPFSQSWIPGLTTVAEWVNAAWIWGTGRRKHAIGVMNTSTKAWTILSAPIPDYVPYGFVSPHSAYAPDQKRVYVSVDEASGTCSHYYINFSAGVAGATVSAFTRPVSGNASPDRNSSGAFTANHPQGKHLWFWPDLGNDSGLICQDLDNNVLLNLAIPSGGANFRARVGMGYDPVNNRVLILKWNVSLSRYELWKIGVPSDHTNAAAYTVVMVPLVAGPGVTVTAPDMDDWHGKARFMVGRGLNVILVPYALNRMLCLRPA